MKEVKKKNEMKMTTRQIALMGLLFALTIILSILEGVISVGLALPMGIKLGLANIVIMYGVFFLKKKHVYSLVILKGLFSLTRGVIAATLSLSGSLLSVTIMIIILHFNKEISYGFISICGAIAHNIGQYLIAVLILDWTKQAFLFYLPVLIVSGIIMGFVTGMVLSTILPTLKKLGLESTIDK